MTPSSEFLVEARGLGLRFAGGIEALRNVDLFLRQGEFVSIVGPSGCGKSTLLRIIAGLLKATEGEPKVAGLSPVRARRQKHDIAFVFQDANLLPWRTVWANVRLPLELSGDSHSETSIDDALKLVSLSEFAQAYPRQLSGGMKMRVSLARALVTRPDLLLLDEPFAALDEITRQRLNEELLEIWDRDRWTALFVTHNVFEAVFLSQRVIVMSARPGRIIAEIPVPFPYPRPPELRAEPEFARLAGQVSASLRGHPS